MATVTKITPAPTLRMDLTEDEALALRAFIGITSPHERETMLREYDATGRSFPRATEILDRNICILSDVYSQLDAALGASNR